MSKGRRFDGEKQLNYKKVFAVIITIVVIIMGGIAIKNLAKKAEEKTGNINRDYYALYANDKWGVLDSNGNTVIEPMYQEMVIVLNNSRDVFLCTYDVNEETGEYKTKIVNSKNEEIYTEYSEFEVLDNFDNVGNVWYESDIFKVKKDGKYGLIDIDGKEVLSTGFDSIEALKGLENSIIVEKDGKYGLVNKSGATIVDAEYSKILKMGDDYKQGYITIDSKNKYGLFSYNGTKILENKYEKIDQIYGEKYFSVTEKGKNILIDTDGRKVKLGDYDKITQINSEGIVFKKDNKFGFMDYDGKTKIKPQYKNLVQINTGILMADKNGKVGLVDINNKTKLPFDYKSIYYEQGAGIYIADDSKYNSSIIDTELNVKFTGILSELNAQNGYMKIKIGDNYKYYNFKFEEKQAKDITSNTLFVSKKDGKYGLVDKDGKVVVDYIYDEIIEQNKYGFSAVKKDGLWGSVDKYGKVVAPPKYKLENNLVIDFIGKWHLGQDLNMNYYCEK